MRIIIDCDQSLWPAAAALVDRDMPGWRARFTRIGWGWHQSHSGAMFFTRRIKDGLSVKQVKPDRNEQ